MNSNSPIGILDSGLGGLSVLNEIRKIMPYENIVYLGDSAWCPYGVRPANEIQSRVFKVTDFLLEQGCKIIVIACNSATINAVEALRANYPTSFVGMEPGIKPAAILSKSGIIGVLATEASLAGEKFHHLVNAHTKGIKVITRPAPRFVELVEQGKLYGDYAEQIVRQETEALTETGADVIVLGCTHYPFLKPLIKKSVASHVQIIDTGAAVAARTADLISNPQPTNNIPFCKIFTTGNIERAKEIVPKLCNDSKAKIIQSTI